MDIDRGFVRSGGHDRIAQQGAYPQPAEVVALAPGGVALLIVRYGSLKRIDDTDIHPHHEICSGAERCRRDGIQTFNR